MQCRYEELASPSCGSAGTDRITIVPIIDALHLYITIIIKLLVAFFIKILYFFNETSLMVKYSYGLSQADDGEDVSRTRNRMWTFEFGLNPGLCIMVLDRLAFETSVGLLGLSSSVVEVEENDKTHSELVYNIVNFTINLLALDFSLVYFF